MRAPNRNRFISPLIHTLSAIGQRSLDLVFPYIAIILATRP